MKQIGGGEERTLTVPRGDGRVRIRARMGLFKQRCGVVLGPGGHTGCLLISRWTDPGDSRKPPRRIWQMVTSLYHAIRQVEHILHEQYGVDLAGGEKEMLIVAIDLAYGIGLDGDLPRSVPDIGGGTRRDRRTGRTHQTQDSEQFRAASD